MRLDSNMVMAFAGLNADARILGNQARLECQNYRLMYSDDPPVGHIARFIASIQQKHTQRGGVRPVGASIMIAGYDTSKKPKLYLTEPSGQCSEWHANSIGNSSKQVVEFLEKNYKEGKRRGDWCFVI